MKISDLMKGQFLRKDLYNSIGAIQSLKKSSVKVGEVPTENTENTSVVREPIADRCAVKKYGYMGLC